MCIRGRGVILKTPKVGRFKTGTQPTGVVIVTAISSSAIVEQFRWQKHLRFKVHWSHSVHGYTLVTAQIAIFLPSRHATQRMVYMSSRCTDTRGW
jgi:hypothetical protein